MAYIPPSIVLSPKGRIANLKVIFDGGEWSWSMAEMECDGIPSLGLRWNGGEGSIGNPQSWGLPTWFIVPEELEKAIQSEIGRKN